MAKSHYFHPSKAITWYHFAIGTIVGGVLLGIGWQLGATFINHYLRKYGLEPTTMHGDRID